MLKKLLFIILVSLLVQTLFVSCASHLGDSSVAPSEAVTPSSPHPSDDGTPVEPAYSPDANDSVESPGQQNDPFDSPEPEITPDEHLWKGNGYRYTSEIHGITFEFPPEWEDVLEIIEQDGQILPCIYPRPRDPSPEYPAFKGIIGYIDVVPAEEKDAIVNKEIWSALPYEVLYDADGIFVYIGYPSEPQYPMEIEADIEAGVRYDIVSDGFRNGLYEIYVTK